MSIKTILMSVSPGENRHDRVAVAVALARRFAAHLDVAYLTAPAGMPDAIAGRGASAAYLAEATAINAEKAPGVKQEVAEACRAAGVDWAWEVLDGDPNAVLGERSRTADLLVVPLHHADSAETGQHLHSTDDLLLASACPVLVLPTRWPAASAGRRVVVAWKDALSAARALRGALPFLAGAEHVVVLRCGDPPEGPDRLPAFLARHGIAAEPASEPVAGSVGETLLAYAGRVAADLLVMGAFGRGRWREQLLGGVTQQVLDHAGIPVLTAH